MTHWLAMVLANGTYEGKQIVDPKALLPALTPQIVSSPATEPAMRSGFYGYGFNVVVDIGGAHGAQPLRCVRARLRDEFRHPAVRRRGDHRADQRHGVRLPETLNAEFADLVQFGEVREDWFELYTIAAEADE